MESPDKKPQARKPRSRKVPQPPNEKVELTVEEPNLIQNKYAPKKKVGANRPKNTVTTVGLGNLQVETIKGYADG